MRMGEVVVEPFAVEHRLSLYFLHMGHIVLLLGQRVQGVDDTYILDLPSCAARRM